MSYVVCLSVSVSAVCGGALAFAHSQVFCNSRSLQDLNGDLEQCNYINYTSIKKFRNGIFTNTSFENFMALSPKPQYPTVEDVVVVVVVVVIAVS